MEKFSVCMSVYKNDMPDYFLQAIRSIYNQTIRPNEIILVVDGPVGKNLKSSIELIQNEIPILKVIWFKENRGHAVARQMALDNTHNDLVALMDSDDISVPERFEKQLELFYNNSDLSVVGGLINEFIDNPENIISTRIVPNTDDDIKSYLRSRCPFNFVTVMMRKKDVLSVGGIKDWYCEEDYYLWIRLMQAGYKFYNIQENLVNVRVGKDTYKRRGGLKYFKSELALQKYMYNERIITYSEYLINVIKRVIVQLLLPNILRTFVYRRFARS